MAQNKILPWAQTSTANALSDADYASDMATNGAYANGVKSGQASSLQANKTWRQGTSVAAGLAQFLVDNLSVDVTDADVPATFSSRITNAITMLGQISNFNQSFATAIGGYRKYAIVSDSSGNYWSSTADQNTTVPGASGSKWQNLFNGYATQSWANTAFVKNNNGSSGGIVSADMDASGVPSFLSGKGTWYPVQLRGDYATNTALSAEASSRANADTTLQNNINDRVWKGGDTMRGTLTIEGATSGFVTQYNPGSPASGTFVNYPGFTSIAEGRGGEFHCQVQEVVGSRFIGLFSLKSANGDWRYVSIPAGSRINDSQYGDVAYTNDLNNYVPTSTYTSDFATSDSRVINLAYGHRIQAFQANVGDGTTSGSWITFPVAFSAPPVFYQANSNGNGDGVTDTDYWCYGATATGMYVRPRNHQGSANIIAIGPK